MKILGIDTSTEFCNLALIEDENILIEYMINGLRKKHSSWLVPAIKNLLETIGLKIEEINGIAVSLGPGSFTGLRIGLSVAKGLCYARSLPLLGIPTLDALAFPLKEIPCLICPVLESKKNEIYDVVFRGGNNFHRVTDYQCEDIQNLLSRLSLLKENIIFLGNGIKKYRGIIQEKIGENAQFVNSRLNLSVAASIAFLGADKLKKGEIDNISIISPVYLRKSEAEIIWEKNNI